MTHESTLVFAPALYGVVYRPRCDKLSADRVAALKQLLASGVDVRELVSPFGGDISERGLLSTKTVTTAGTDALAQAFQGAFTLGNFKFHGFGTGTTAEAAAHANLVTELTTAYASDSVRPTGSQANGASNSAYKTIATLSPDANCAITEHGLFSNSTVGQGVLWDRSVFSAINLVGSSDSLQVTYELTLTANG